MGVLAVKGNSAFHLIFPLTLEEEAPIQLRGKLVAEYETASIRAAAHFAQGRNLNVFPLRRMFPLGELHLELMPDLRSRRKGIVALDGVDRFLAFLDASAARGSVDVA